jgi:hypothetical protein
MSSEKFLMSPVIVFLILLAKMKKLTSEAQAPTGHNLFASDDKVK